MVGTALVLAAISLALTRARPDEPRATIAVWVDERGGPSGTELAAVVNGRLESRELTSYVAWSWGPTWFRDGRPLLRSATTVEEPAKSARKVEITFRGPIPERSVRLARLVATGITETSSRAVSGLLRAEGEAKLADVRRRLADPEIDAKLRRALRRQEAYFKAALPGMREQPALRGHLLTRQAGESARLTSLLPGDDPPRPSPAWAALAGGLAAGVCWVLWLLLCHGPVRAAARGG